jgi:NAD(P)-dependent dehydrogenase (short-subunit alcohol dehydrogenase family)
VTLDRSAVDLDGRVAVVTGGAQGIGAACATGLAAFGADLALCDRNAEGMRATAAEVERLGRRVVTGELDVRDGEAVARFVDDVGRAFGVVDVLVNNAGGGFWAMFLDVSAKGQAALVDENFTSVTHFVRACVPLMTRGGSIVNVTSIEGSRAGPGFGIYSAMKAAVESLTKTLALELADRRIRVNCIAPDAIPTPGDAGLAEAITGPGSSDYGWKIPLGMGEADDCAAAVVYLASDLAKFVTGNILHVDGGSWAASGWRRRSPEEPWQA